ncbi:YrdB family protein [Microbacterium sp. LWO13-1.2]|uniref:YrdB family protein n=1 Tax=Microbacterium sp. LWO13-1.2 TaxID=3135262 RepID=UPI003139BF22
MTPPVNPLDNASPLLATALVARFLIELALLAGAAVAAWRLLPGPWGWVAAVVAPVSVAVVWGLLLSPRARFVLPEPMKLALETVLFVGVALALSLTGLGVPAIIGFVVWAVDRIAIAVLAPRRGAQRVT